jgi:hypothetical protein
VKFALGCDGALDQHTLALGFEERIDDALDASHIEVRSFQRRDDGALWKARLLLHARVALFTGGKEHAPVLHEGRRRVLVERGDA